MHRFETARCSLARTVFPADVFAEIRNIAAMGRLAIGNRVPRPIAVAIEAKRRAGERMSGAAFTTRFLRKTLLRA